MKNRDAHHILGRTTLRRFATILLCLSALAMGQNVLVATPASSAPARPGIEQTGPDPTAAATCDGAAAVSRDVPAPASLMLLVVGLSGLAAVSGRPEADPDRGDRATG
ncbi:MAG TPA: hypothetical protein ENI85_16705 [Deltaproteobacteria bacterium]|nr:hypothetical protein [Deltaproteobacteria bacterium]